MIQRACGKRDLVVWVALIEIVLRSLCLGHALEETLGCPCGGLVGSGFEVVAL
ncbi:hypothetical protein M758_9G139500 [Ceratodon purpureus]|nr:hypothetical protein M758_9G139500 [Ceratodon purpureus]